MAGNARVLAIVRPLMEASATSHYASLIAWLTIRTVNLDLCKFDNRKPARLANRRRMHRLTGIFHAPDALILEVLTVHPKARNCERVLKMQRRISVSKERSSVCDRCAGLERPRLWVRAAIKF